MTLVETYVAELVDTVSAHLGARLAGIWIFGSGALGDFDPRRSDLDIQAVTTTLVPLGRRRRLAAALSRGAVDCPVRGLEFVLYSRADLNDPRGPAFQLNLNTGPRMDRHVAYSADDDPRFWFVLDVAIGREHGRPLAGPAPGEVFPRLADPLVLQALRDALAWHRVHDASGVSQVLAACRAWAWAADGRWRSKTEAAAWAAERLEDPSPVRLAIEGRADPTRTALSQDQVEVVTKNARRALRLAGAATSLSRGA